MNYFYDEPDSPKKSHDDLCSAVQGMDVERIKSLLVGGARPLAGQTRNPLAIASTGPPTARLSPDREVVVDLLLEVVDPKLDSELIEGAFYEAFQAGDRPILDKLFPKLEQGIDTLVRGKRILMCALLDLGQESSGYSGQMSGLERFSWTMEKNPDMSASPGLKATQALEFLPFALYRLSSSGSMRNLNERALYAHATDCLIKARAPVWFEESPQSFRAARNIAESETPRWLSYLVEAFPRPQLEQVMEELKRPSARALLHEQVMKADLEGQDEKESPPAPRPSSRF